jgi:hypothetical protein
VRTCIIGAGLLAPLTTWLAFIYAFEEPFGRFEANDAYLYLGVGSVLLVGWVIVAAGATYLTTVRTKRIGSAALLIVSIVGMWMATWTPRAYVADVCRMARQADPLACAE